MLTLPTQHRAHEHLHWTRRQLGTSNLLLASGHLCDTQIVLQVIFRECIRLVDFVTQDEDRSGRNLLVVQQTDQLFARLVDSFLIGNINQKYYSVHCGEIVLPNTSG